MNCYYQIDTINSFQPSLQYFIPLLPISQPLNYQNFSQTLYPFHTAITPENHIYSLVSATEGHNAPSRFVGSHISPPSKNNMQNN